MNKLFFLTCILCIKIIGLAQNKSVLKSAFFSDFKKSWDKQPVYNFTSEVTTILYTDRLKSTVVSSDKGVLRSGSDKFLMYQGSTSFFLQTEKFGVTIDSMVQQIIVSPNKNIQSKTQVWNSILKDSLNYSIVKNQINGRIIYVVKEIKPISEFEIMEFSFDLKSGFLLELSIEYWESEYVINSLSQEKKDRPFMTMNYKTELTALNNEIILRELSKIFETVLPELKLSTSYSAYQIKDLRINLKSN